MDRAAGTNPDIKGTKVPRSASVTSGLAFLAAVVTLVFAVVDTDPGHHGRGLVAVLAALAIVTVLTGWARVARALPAPGAGSAASYSPPASASGGSPVDNDEGRSNLE